MLDDVDAAIDVCEEKYKGCQCLFLFDHSTCHGSFADDALRANLMSAGWGGKQPLMKETSWTDTNGTIHTQSMVFEQRDIPVSAFGGQGEAPDDCIGEAKGLKQVLFERGLITEDVAKSKRFRRQNNDGNIIEEKFWSTDVCICIVF